MEHAVDAKTDLQLLLLRLDMDIRRLDLNSIFEHRLQQLDHRGVLGTLPLSQSAEVHDIPDVLAQLPRQVGDLLGTTVYPVYGQG